MICRGRNCNESLRKGTDPYCGWCRSEIEVDAIGVLVSLAGDGSYRAQAERAEAILDLRDLGYSSDEVVIARGQASDGWSVERILEGLRSGAGVAV